MRVVVAVLLVVLAAAAHAAALPRALVRVNQVGWTPGASKRAVLMARTSAAGAPFRVVDGGGATVLAGVVPASVGKWSAAFKAVHVLDLSALATPGTYTVAVDGAVPATSPPFRIASGGALYGPLLANVRRWFLLQRDGADVDPSVLGRQPSHLADQQATAYTTPSFTASGALQGGLTAVGGPLDVSGGWFDAGDYLKLVQTTSWVTAAMLVAVRDQRALLDGAGADLASEARVGVDWLLRMWDDATGTLHYQVGIGDGNAQVEGDHDVWRLPEADDALVASPGSPSWFRKHRPVLRLGPAGTPVSPNLAGRLAASFALCFQVYRAADAPYAARCLRAAEHVFDLADTSAPSQLVTAAPWDFYPETEWRDDLELGAAELALAVASGGLPSGLPHTDPATYLAASATWARAYLDGPGHGADTLNLYDTSALAHRELHRALVDAGSPSGLAVDTADLRADLRAQLDGAAARAVAEPFGVGVGYRDGDVVPHVLGLAVTAALYEDASGDPTYRGFAQRQLDFVLGANGWGTSFVVGAGSTFPRCLQHQVANLVGGLDGSAPLALGATVDGPGDQREFRHLGVPDGARACPADRSDPYKKLGPKRVRYMDAVVAWPSVEPANDYAVMGLLAFVDAAMGS